ncbi:hypothetical protein [Fictibacillus barbaricus]|uniref:Lipoprotein n=1 Tax=Fictibacillus barbaricus TaxID=182136 RepID=A0ABU1TWW8_9BACL|nr:hypothetical protein [Fictibacillus barbaricus]MDR7071700.1 hypothetical protein [Fictibacillus barbaricus]
MKRITYICSAVAALLLVNACSAEKDAPQKSEQIDNKEVDKANESKQEQNDNSKENQDQQSNNDADLTEEEVLAAIKNQSHTQIPIVLPKKLPLKMDEHLTATTKSDPSSFQVMFFTSTKPIPINNEKLKKKNSEAVPLVRLTVHKYNSEKEADEQIAYQDFSKIGGQKIDLGHNIIGYQDAGAGSLWISWNEGRWSLTSHTQTSRSEDGEQLSRDAVEYLETHTLPIPKPHGYVHVDATGMDNRILWQNGTTVYTLDQFNDPMSALIIAAMFE